MSEQRLSHAPLGGVVYNVQRSLLMNQERRPAGFELIQQPFHGCSRLCLSRVEAGGLVVCHCKCEALNGGRKERRGVGVSIYSVLIE